MSIVELPKVGEIFTANLDRKSSAGNGIIKVENGSVDGINVGQVDSKPGDSLEICYIGGEAGLSLGDIEDNDEYTHPAPIRLEDSNKKCNVSVGDVLEITFNKFKSLGHPVAETNGCEIHVPLWGGSSKYVGESKIVKIKFKAGQFAIGRVHKQGSDGASQEENAISDVKEEGEQSAKLNELRRKANEASENKPTSTTQTSRTKEYNRSNKVKRYVKECAGGYCEGCGNPAPFENSQGEPYLHAHHVHEFSEGGVDSPITVIALCPNCHFRVHHGKNGDEYNQELIKQLSEIESVPFEKILSLN